VGGGETIEATLRASGYVVEPQQAICRRLITEHYGNRRSASRDPAEINRAFIWMSGATNDPRHLQAWRQTSRTLAQRLAEIPSYELRPYRAAADSRTKPRLLS